MTRPQASRVRLWGPQFQREPGSIRLVAAFLVHDDHVSVAVAHKEPFVPLPAAQDAEIPRRFARREVDHEDPFTPTDTPRPPSVKICTRDEKAVDPRRTADAGGAHAGTIVNSTVGAGFLPQIEAKSPEDPPLDPLWGARRLARSRVQDISPLNHLKDNQREPRIHEDN